MNGRNDAKVIINILIGVAGIVIAFLSYLFLSGWLLGIFLVISGLCLGVAKWLAMVRDSMPD